MGTGTVSYAATRKCTAPGMLPSMSQWKPEKSCLFSHQVFPAVCLVVSCTAKKVCMWCVHSGRHQVSSHIPSSSSSFLLKREQFLGSRLNDKVQKGGSAAGLSPTICPSKSITLSASTKNPRSKKDLLSLNQSQRFFCSLMLAWWNISQVRSRPRVALGLQNGDIPKGLSILASPVLLFLPSWLSYQALAVHPSIALLTSYLIWAHT